jgi:hypothetical protein
VSTFEKRTGFARDPPTLKKPRNEVIYMAKKEELTIDERIKKEKNRLVKIYKEVGKDNKAIIDGLIQRAAYMRITLEDWEKDITINGYFEMFTQSDKMVPYERERPVARLYNTMNGNYQKIIKQLSDLVPKEKKVVANDGFDDFVDSRTD